MATAVILVCVCSCHGQRSLICRRIEASQRWVKHVVSTARVELCACNKGLCSLRILKFSFMDSPSFQYQWCVTALKVVEELDFFSTTSSYNSFKQTSANSCNNCLGVIGCSGNKPGRVGELYEWSQHRGKQITASVFQCHHQENISFISTSSF